jgi:hypothetical protein
MSRDAKHDLYDGLKKISSKAGSLVIVGGSIFYKKTVGGGMARRRHREQSRGCDRSLAALQSPGFGRSIGQQSERCLPRGMEHAPRCPGQNDTARHN